MSHTTTSYDTTHSPRIDRRTWLAAAATTAVASTLPALSLGDSKKPRPRVAVVLTELTHRSHAHVLMENFVQPYYFNGELTDPGVDVVSMYVDQFPKDRDRARVVAKQFSIPIYPSIGEALCCGGERLDVDAVLSIGEHGTYPSTERGQRMYPRKRFFDEIVAVFRASERVVPVFNDKHLSYRWDWSAEMMETAKELKIPFMAGSSVPLAQRRPPLELADNVEMTEAVSIHGGPIESYDFHALEVLQSFVEKRRGGETGIRDIQLIEGEAVWEAGKKGLWNYELAQAAMRAEAGKDVGPLEDYVEPKTGEKHPVHAILIRYRDGLRATILRMGHSSTRWNFACKVKDSSKTKDSPKIEATSFYVGPWDNRNLFKALSHAIQTHFREKRAPYPVERTHLVTGMLASAMDSRFEDHSVKPTPHLNIAYQPRDFRAMREMGASWKILTEDIPEPEGISPHRGATRH